MKVVKEILEDLEDKIQFLDDRIVELLLRNISCLLYTSDAADEL